MMQRREQVMMDLAAAQQDAANEEQRERGEMEEDAGEGEVERDLDDEDLESQSHAGAKIALHVSAGLACCALLS